MAAAATFALFFFFFFFTSSPVCGLSNEEDVYALNVLFTTLNSPPLTGWMANGGDPCAEAWQGVACAGPNITKLTISGLSLTGALGPSLGNLTALIVLDLSNNFLSNDIPFQLPPHIQQLILSNNRFTGDLPLSLTALSNLDILNVGTNMLSGAIPDVFNQLGSLTTLDLSNNSLSGSLPASIGDLTSLTTLYLQNNHLSGTVDILANLPLKDLDISNNSFTGWVPPELTSIPSFKESGNQFSTSPAPSPPPSSFFSSPPPRGRSSQKSRHKSSSGKGQSPSSTGSGTYLTKGRIVGIVIAAILGVVATSLAVLFFAWRFQENKEAAEKHELGALWQGFVVPSKDQKDNLELKAKPGIAILKPPPLEKYKSMLTTSRIKSIESMNTPIACAAYSIAELQNITNSFSQENLLGEGFFGQVYRAELSSGKQLAVKKLDSAVCAMQLEDLTKIVSNISRLRHPNILELVGYCVEHGEHLLVYEYINNGTLHESLHSGEDSSRRLSWDIRVKIALGVAQALDYVIRRVFAIASRYLHEVSIPPIVHHNLKSNNILLDEEYNPHLADCGLLSSGLEQQVPAQHLGSLEYGAPEYTMSGIYTVKSDIYSFGVVMLELLTGRKPLDSSRPRAEHSLVRWATPHLHDIDALAKMVDPAVKGTYPAKALSRFADVIVLCVQPEPEFRPSISEVVQSLAHLMH